MARKRLISAVIMTFVVALVVWRGGHHSTSPPTATRTVTTYRSAPSGSQKPLLTPPAVTAPPTPSTSSSTAVSVIDPNVAPDQVDDSPEEIWRSIEALSATSGFPAAIAQELSTQAQALVIADLTGQGRDEFAGYWGSDTPEAFRPLYEQVQPHAAGVTPLGEPGLAQVLVGYSAVHIEADGTRTSQPVKRTIVYFVRDQNTWKPVHR